MALSEAEISRYTRQLLLPRFGESGQERLQVARVRVVGSGSVAGPAALYLAQAGIGTLLIDDPGAIVPGSGAAWLCGPEDRDRPFAEAVTDALRQVNAFSSARVYDQADRVTAALICAESQDRRLVTAAEARRADLPAVVVEMDGENGAVIVIPAGGPCYACSAPRAGGTVESGARAGAAAAAVGALAALELILLLSGAGEEPRAKRIEVVRGVLSSAPTTRTPGCSCWQDDPIGAHIQSEV